MRGKFLLFTISYLLFTISCLYGAGTTVLDFLNIGIGARPAGMGEAFIALADDANAVYWNPAGLAGLKRKEATFTYNHWFEGIRYNYLAYVQPFKVGTFGGSVYYVDYGSIQGYTVGGVPTKVLEPWNFTGVISYGKNLTPERKNSIFAGANLKFIYEDLVADSTLATALDLGALYELPFAMPLNLGVMLQNIGPAVRFKQEREALPFNFKVGSAAKFLDESLIFVMDVTIPIEDKPFVNVGSEYYLYNYIIPRVGYRGGQASGSGFRCGLGIRGKNLFLDYSFAPYGDLGWTHRVSLSFRFGEMYGFTQIEKELEEQFKKARVYFHQGQLLKAYRNLKEILALAPNHKGANDFLLRTRVKVKKSMTSKEINQLLASGKKYFKNGDIIRAREEFNTVLFFDSNNLHANYSLRQIEARFEEVVESLFTRGLDYYKRADYDKAIIELNKVLALNSEHEEAQRYVHLIKEEQEKIKQFKLIQKAEEHFNEGLILYSDKKFTAALGQFENTRKLNLEHKDILSWIIKTRTKIKTIESKRERKKKEEIVARYYEESVRYYEEGNLNEAVVGFKKLLNLKPTHLKARSYFNEINIILKQQNEVKVKEYNRKGLIQYHKGNIGDAIKLWEKALKLDPSQEEIKANLERAKKEIQ